MNYMQLCKIIMDTIPVTKEIFPDSRLSSDLGLCSFDMMLLLFQIEKIIGTQVDLSLLKNDMTVSEMLNIL